MASFRVPRMQTNAVWQSPPIKLTAGKPAVVVDPTSWTVSGAAVGSSGRLDLTIGNGRLAIASQRLVISLSVADCAALGVGKVTFEVLRTSPAPAPRPLFRFAISNHQAT